VLFGASGCFIFEASSISSSDVSGRQINKQRAGIPSRRAVLLTQLNLDDDGSGGNPLLPMNYIPHPDGSHLLFSTDDDPSRLSMLLDSFGIPVAAIEESARRRAAAIGKACCDTCNCEIGWIAFHAGYSSPSKNGWTFTIADRPHSTAATETRALWASFKANMAADSIDLKLGDSMSQIQAASLAENFSPSSSLRFMFDDGSEFMRCRGESLQFVVARDEFLSEEVREAQAGSARRFLENPGHCAIQSRRITTGTWILSAHGGAPAHLDRVVLVCADPPSGLAMEFAETLIRGLRKLTGRGAK